MTPKVKKILIISAAVVVLGIVGLMLLDFLTTEQLTVTASDPKAKLTLSSSLNRQVGEGEGRISMRVKPGAYAVEAVAGEQKTRAMLQVAKGKPVDVKLNLTPLKTVSTVSDYIADYPAASDTEVRFIWGDYHKLVRYNLADHSLRQIDAQQGEYSQAIWINQSQAYVADTADTYYFFDGTNSKILPYAVWSGTLTATSAGRVAYVDASGKRVVVRPSAFAEPIYTVDTGLSQPQLSLGAQDHLLIYETAIDSEDSQNSDTSPAVYQGDKKLDAASTLIKDLAVDSGRWSPDGAKLAFSTAGGLYLLDTATTTLTQLYSSPPTNPQSILWKDASTLLYFQDQDLWQVKLGDVPIWTKLAHTDTSISTIAPLALSPSNKLYFSGQTSWLQGSLFMVDLAQ